MTQNTSLMRLLILDTAENAAERVVSLLAKNRVLNTSERIEDKKSRLFEALKTRQWDILLLNEDAREVDATECVDFIRKHDIDTASVVLQRQEFDVRQLAEATRKGIAGLASLEQPEYSLSMLEKVMQNISERRNRQKLEHGSNEAIAYIHDGMHVFANESYIKLFQYSDLEEVLATPFMDMVAEECRKEIKLSLRNSQKSGKPTDEAQQIARMEIVALDAKKAAFPANLCLKPTYYEGEHCLQVLITGKHSQDSVVTRMVVKNNRHEEVAGTMATGLLSQESIAAALEHNSLVLVYQPVMSTSVMKPEFYDIHPQMRGPDQQIFTAEQIASVVGNTALGQQLDRWVSARVIRMLGDLGKQGLEQQFQLTITTQTVVDAAFSEWLDSLLTECGVEADSLVVNIRESDVLAHTAEAMALINSLNDGGIRVCISGYTNSEAIAAVVNGCRVGLVRFDNDITEADSRNMLSLEDLKKLVASLHKNAVKVIAADVQDKQTVDCLWLAEVDLVEGAWFQREAQELHAASFRPDIPVLRNVVWK